jgi:hypothetical protein
MARIRQEMGKQNSKFHINYCKIQLQSVCGKTMEIEYVIDGMA